MRSPISAVTVPVDIVLTREPLRLAHIETNCTDINRALFSYTYGVMVLGAANMYNFVSLP